MKPMNKLILAFAVGCAVASASCNRHEGDRRSGATDASGLADAQLPVNGVQATNSAVVGKVESSGSAGAPARARPRFGTLLASEATVIEGEGLSVARVTQVITGREFPRFVEKLAAEAATDPLAQDLVAAERKRWEGKLAGRGSLGSFACGLSVCAGSIDLGANTAAYDEIANDYLAHGSQGGSLLDYRVDRGDGTFEQRFVMSVDPAVSGVTFNKPPTAPRRNPEPQG
jgi:hypothetical protein